MAVKYSKIFTVTSATTGESITILVDYVEAEGFRGISIESLEGDYHSAEQFGIYSKRAREIPDKIYQIIPIIPSDARKFVDALNGALQASEEV